MLLNRLLSISQKVYAESLGISESAASRRKSDGHFAEMAKEISVLGLRLVPPEVVVVQVSYLKSIETLADIGLRSERYKADMRGWR